VSLAFPGMIFRPGPSIGGVLCKGFSDNSYRKPGMSNDNVIEVLQKRTVL
jgi:hypothetical protein